VVDPNNFLPVETVMTTVTAIGSGDMITRLERCVQQPIGRMAQLALSGSTGKTRSFVATLTLQVPVCAKQFKSRFKMIKVISLRHGGRNLNHQGERQTKPKQASIYCYH
jgi:hypothetical protein